MKEIKINGETFYEVTDEELKKFLGSYNKTKDDEISESKKVAWKKLREIVKSNDTYYAMKYITPEFMSLYRMIMTTPDDYDEGNDIKVVIDHLIYFYKMLFNVERIKNNLDEVINEFDEGDGE